jgi:hypothetical protein
VEASLALAVGVLAVWCQDWRVGLRTVSAYWKAPSVNYFVGLLDFVGAPFLHRRAVDVLLLMLHVSGQLTRWSFYHGGRAYIKGHPTNRLIFRNLRLLDQFQLQALIVECDRDYHTWRRPCADHEMMFDHVAVPSLYCTPYLPQKDDRARSTFQCQQLPFTTVLDIKDLCRISIPS